MSHYEKREEGVVDHNQNQGAAEASCVSVKIDRSTENTLNFRDGTVALNSRDDQTILQQDTDQKADYELQRAKDQHKISVKNKYDSVYERNRIYAQLCIIHGENEGVNEEHEVLCMEKKARLEDTSINCNNIFKDPPGPGCKKGKIKVVLTKGMAGIGKTVSVQKFILDWAEGKANQDVDFMFVLPFREMNLIQHHQYSLHRLVLEFHPELQDLDSKFYEQCKVVFIFDGLDESRTKLTFSDSEKISDVTETSSVGMLISNVMKGDLLPSAYIWITSRPAAANQIPSKNIDRVTEIQGFNEHQKEEYFRKRVSDEYQASRIISHITRIRSLQIMCHIPVFCWISSTVLQKLLKDDLNAEIPQTLTEIYIHFLLSQINVGNQKHEERDPEKLQQQSNKEVIVKLAELAFKQLMKGNVMFSEEDLIESGIGITDGSVYSGICTEIFKEESVIHQRKVYSFIHLSFQEFLSALYVSHCHVMNNMEPLQLFLDDKNEKDRPKSNRRRSKKMSLFQLLKLAADKTNQIENGNLDLFLRFLLGISLDSNQELLKDLLSQTEDNSKNIKGFKRYIQNTIKTNDNLSVNKCINLFLCLLEMNDQTLYQEIQEFVKSDKKSDMYLSSAHCSVIAFVLQISEEVLDEFNPMEYKTTEEGRWRLIPAVINSTKALLGRMRLSIQQCDSLSLALRSSNSCLKQLDLSNNNLQDSSVKLLAAGLKSSHCQLNILRLARCHLSHQCCESLSSALLSSNSLTELDLSNNALQDLGVNLLSAGLKNSNCKLNILRLSGCMLTEKGCDYVSSALSSNPSHLRELDLSYNHPGDSGVNLLSEKLEDAKYRLDKLNMDHGGEFRIKAGLHKYFCDLTLDPITANKDLILSEDNKKVTYVEETQAYPEHPERFERLPQVLSRESLSGRCYWEVEWSGHTDIAVAYKGIGRRGKRADCWFGFNNNSWCLACMYDTFCAWYNYHATDTHVSLSSSNRIGVYVDVSAGILSFYDVSKAHKLIHIHTFNNTFTEPLYAGFGLIAYAFNSTLSLCQSDNPAGNNTDD